MNKKMNKQQRMVYEKILKEMEQAIQMTDYEAAHSLEDELLCELLDSLGFQDVVETYWKGNKWYC